MATVTKKPSTKKAARKKAAPQDVSTPDIDAIVAAATKAAVEATSALLAQALADLKPQPVKPPTGPAVVESEVYDTPPLTAEQVAAMSEDEVEAYNQREAAKLASRKRRLANNRRELDNLSQQERAKRIKGQRDPSIIRKSDNPYGEPMIDAKTKRARISLENGEMSEPGEHIQVPRSFALTLQEQGKIEILI